MKEIIIASGNKGKIREAQEILDEYNIVSIKDIGLDIDVEEDGKTFEENAIKKAETIAKELNGKLCISDDSGIEIEYLNGFPGVRTKRWHNGTDRERNLAIIEKLKGIPREKRKIKFVTAIAVSDGKNTIFSRNFKWRKEQNKCKKDCTRKNKEEIRRNLINIILKEKDKWKY